MTAAPVPAALATALPVWACERELGGAGEVLRARPALVGLAACLALRRRLADVAGGTGQALQGGDCAELFAEVSPAGTARKVAQLRTLGDLLTATTDQSTVAVGRIAGQFAKPRSDAMEAGPGGTLLPVYRGDAVNALTATAEARTPDPWRLVTAYDVAERVLADLPADVWASHEALLPEYEDALVRTDPATGVRYSSSGHLLWAGHRTRQLEGPQIALLAGIENPVAVKLGPGVTPDALEALVDRLDPGRTPGRLTLIARFGADRVEDRLPALAETTRRCGARPVWLSDPMHGNTVRTAQGRKTRALPDVIAEATAFARVLLAAGCRPGGLHLELTPDDVTECVDTRAEVTGAALPRYRTACDPRLNPEQARAVVSAYATVLTP